MWVHNNWASVGLGRPLLRLRLTPRRRVATAAPSEGGMPPPLEGGTKTVLQQGGQGDRWSNQPIEGGGGSTTTTKWWGWGN